MSLVEQALAKMRTAAATSARPETATARPSPVGRLQDSAELLGSHPPAPDATPANRKRVHVDRNLLKSAGLLAPDDQERQVANEYRHVKRPLLEEAVVLEEQGVPGHNLIMVTSAFSGEGKSFTSVNLAMSLSLEKDRSVLLVDADVIKPHVSRLFGVDGQPGLLDLLRSDATDIESLIIDSDIPGLQILPAGHKDEHATELLASRRMLAVVSALAHRNPSRMVVFDSPPVLQTSEAKVLAGLVGQVVMVVAASETAQAAVLEAVRSVGSEARVRMLLNKTRRSAMDYYQYGRGYGYGYQDSAAGTPGGR